MFVLPSSTAARTAVLLCAAVFLNGCQVLSQQVAKHRNALWIIAHDMCVADYERNGSPSPCAEVNMAVGYVVVKDRRGNAQYLLIPTERITGMEDPAILKSDAPDYFYYAWQNRDRVGLALHKPLTDDQIGLSINPVNARSQDQLHIHIDCIDPDVRRDLDRHIAQFTDNWSEWQWDGDTYQVRRIRRDQFKQTNPFKAVASEIPGASTDMGKHTIFLTAAPGGDFLMIERHLAVRGLDGSGAETLQDHGCRIVG